MRPPADGLPPPIIRLRDEGYLHAGSPDLNLVPLTRAVTFDTNAYRVFTHGLSHDDAARKIGRLRHVERLGGIQAFAHPWVIMELCVHLVDPDDPAFSDCLTALRAVYQHCVDHRSGHPQLAMLADPESQLCYSLHGDAPADLRRRCLVLGELAKVAFEQPDRITVPPAGRMYVETAAMVHQIERQWVKHLRRWVLELFLPGAKDWGAIHRNPKARRAALKYLETEAWMRWLARTHVAASILRLRGERWDDPDMEEKVTWLLSEFPAPFRLYTEIVRGIIMSGADSSRHPRVNAVTDMQLAFSVGPRHTLSGDMPLLLVTGDRAISHAAGAVGCGDKVAPLEEYLAIFPDGLLL